MPLNIHSRMIDTKDNYKGWLQNDKYNKIPKRFYLYPYADLVTFILRYSRYSSIEIVGLEQISLPREDQGECKKGPARVSSSGYYKTCAWVSNAK